MKKVKKIIDYEVTQLGKQKLNMLEFSRHLGQLKFTGKIRPAPFGGAKQANFKVTGKKVMALKVMIHILEKNTQIHKNTNT